MTSDAGLGDPIATLMIVGHGNHPMRGLVTVGRDPRAGEGVTIEVSGDPLVSKSHLSLDTDQGDVIITDLGSSNGTFLHHAAGETAVPSDRWIPVPEGAEIEFGDQRMTIERAGTGAVVDGASHDATTIENVEPMARPVEAISGSFWSDDAADETSAGTSPAAAVPGDHLIECSNCDRALPPGSKFCDGCGTPVMPEAAPERPAEPPAEPPHEDAGHTVVVPQGGYHVANPTPAAIAPEAPAPQPGPPAAQYAAAPQYGGVQPGSPSPVAPPGHPPAPQSFAGAAPQYDGGLNFVDPAASQTNGGAGKKIALAVGVVVVLGLLGIGLVSVLGGDSAAGGRGVGAAVPTELEELWSTDVEGALPVPAVGESAVFVISEDDDDLLVTSLTRDDGDENWDVIIDEADFGRFVGEFDDVVVISVCAFDADTTCAVVGLDSEDGDEIWRDSLDDGVAFMNAGGLIVSDEDGVTLLDPATGDRIERIRGDSNFADLNGLLVDDDGEVSAYDTELRPIFGPVDVDVDQANAGTFDGERLLVAFDDEIEYVDDTGDTTSGPLLDGEITRLVAVDSTTLVAELGDEVVVYDLDGDDAEERWSENGILFSVAEPDGGAVAIIDTGTERVVVDLESGDDRFDIDAEGFDVVTQQASNAFVAIDRTDSTGFSGDATITAFDWITGDEIWSEQVEGEVSIADIVVVVETDGDVTAFG